MILYLHIKYSKLIYLHTLTRVQLNPKSCFYISRSKSERDSYRASVDSRYERLAHCTSFLYLGQIPTPKKIANQHSWISMSHFWRTSPLLGPPSLRLGVEKLAKWGLCIRPLLLYKGHHSKLRFSFIDSPVFFWFFCWNLFLHVLFEGFLFFCFINNNLPVFFLTPHSFQGQCRVAAISHSLWAIWVD